MTADQLPAYQTGAPPQPGLRHPRTPVRAVGRRIALAMALVGCSCGRTITEPDTPCPAHATTRTPILSARGDTVGFIIQTRSCAR